MVDKSVAILAVAAALVALYTDLRWRKIFNWLTLPLLAIGPILQLCLHGWSGLATSLLGAGTIFVCLTLCALLAGPGLSGGDIKLLAALGSLFGAPGAAWLVLYTVASGFFVVVLMLLWQGLLRRTFTNMVRNMRRRAAGEAGVSLSEASPAPRIPYAVCISCGTALALARCVAW